MSPILPQHASYVLILSHLVHPRKAAENPETSDGARDEPSGLQHLRES
jgi:hypothetical protein